MINNKQKTNIMLLASSSFDNVMEQKDYENNIYDRLKLPPVEVLASAEKTKQTKKGGKSKMMFNDTKTNDTNLSSTATKINTTTTTTTRSTMLKTDKRRISPSLSCDTLIHQHQNNQAVSTKQPKRRNNNIAKRFVGCCLSQNGAIKSFLLIITIFCFVLINSLTWALESNSNSNSIASKVVSQVANKLKQTNGGVNKLVQNIDFAKSSNQINEWLVKEVAPAMATKLIDNVLQAPKTSTSNGGSKKGKSIVDSETSKIDTQVLADKIVDKLADSLKKRKRTAKSSYKLDDKMKKEEQEAPAMGEQRTSTTKSSSGPANHNRKGKSLVSNSVQIVQNLLNRDNRKFFGRAMEKSKSPLRSANSNSWLMVKEPVYDQHLFSSTDSSQLDENPVVLRAEHGYNSTSTVSPLHHHHYQQQNQAEQQYQQQQQQQQQQQNLSPLISNLMSSPATNQIGNKLLERHRLQQKYVHTNRHHQQHLAPKPYQPQPMIPQQHNRRHHHHHQQQSPYSLSVTSDMNIVQAPSSPAPPPTILLTSTTPPTTTSTSTTTTTSAPIPSYVSYQQQQSAQPAAAFTQISANKFKINNRHQHPSASFTQSSSWHNTNRNQYNNNNHRFQHHHHQHSPPTTSTTTTTTTSTTTTTTPEPPPQTEPTAETMESLLDLEQQTSSPVVSSIISSVIQSGSELLSQHSNSAQDDYSYTNSSYHRPSAASSSSSSGSMVKGGASPSTTTARHSIISAEAIPTALGAPLYHLNRANFTATSIMGPPPRRSSTSPVAKAAAQYLQKGLNNLSSTIFGRQNKNWARRLGLSSVLLSSLLYGAAILSNPGAPLPTSGLEVLQALTKNKRRRGARESIIPPINDANRLAALNGQQINTALLDANNLNFLYQQQQLLPIIEHLIQQEQQQQQQQQGNSIFSQRNANTSPIEIQSLDDGDRASRRASSSQYYTIQAMPTLNSASVSDVNVVGSNNQKYQRHIPLTQNNNMGRRRR